MTVGATTLDLVALEEARDLRLVGGKARGLSRVRASGLPVPLAFVLTSAAFERWLSETGLDRRIAEADAIVNIVDPAGEREAAATIRSLVLATPLSPAITDEIGRTAATLLPTGPVAVRSSAVGEDGETASFAGQLDSVLNVVTEDGIMNAVLHCWASYWSERACSYRRLRAAPLDGMAVIIQHQVAAVASGVLFTREPECGASKSASADLLIEYCAGLGDALVSGTIDPGRVRITRADLGVHTLQELPDRERRDPVSRVLTDERLQALARMALRLELELGGPQDIEWAIDSTGTLWILQARPITTGRAVPAPRRSVRTSVWTNANINENFPGPVCPLLYSIASAGYYHYFRNLGVAFGISRRRLAKMERPLRTIIGVHGARLYYNLTNIHAVLRMAPFGERLAAAFNEFVGADRIAASPDGALRWSDERSRAVQALEIARIVTKTTWQYIFLRRRLESFERTADAFASSTSSDALVRRSLPELAGDLAAFVDIRCHRWKDASLADAAAMVTYALLQRSLGAAGSGALHNRLLRSLPGVPSSKPPLELWRLSRLIRADPWLVRLFATADTPSILSALDTDERGAAFKVELTRFLVEWGFRSSAELMLTMPSLEEQPGPAIDLLRQYALTEGESPASAMTRQATERIAETSRLLRRLAVRSPVRALLIWRVLTWTQRSIAYRERARLKQALLYTRCRRVALAIGDALVRNGSLASRNDIFFLTWQEIDEVAAGRAMFPCGLHSLVSVRRREHDRLSALEPPDTFELDEGEYLDPGASEATTRRRNNGLPVAAGLSDDSDDTLHGVSACGGSVTSRAAVLGDVSEAHRLSRGDVLVTRQTDPGWGPVFCLVSGLVIERGGMLSHGAIIAREFGLPCVVGVRDATRLIPHGRQVTVDGDRGTCSIGAILP